MAAVFAAARRQTTHTTPSLKSVGVFQQIQMETTLYAPDPKQQQIRCQIFRDLLELFLRGRRH